MNSRYMTLIADSDHLLRRFACLVDEKSEKYSLVIEYNRKTKMNFELISSGNHDIGIVDVCKYLEKQVTYFDGNWINHPQDETFETLFYSGGEFFHFRHLFNTQPNGDIGHLTISETLLKKDFQEIKAWFKNLRDYDCGPSMGFPGELIELVQ